VTFIPLGHAVGSTGRNTVGEVDEDVRIVAQESRVDRRWSCAVSDLDALRSGLLVRDVEVVEACECSLRMEGMKASMSSRISEWMRRWVLLWRVGSKR
jgi:hypothetical protein